jgi:hypothetical protein
MGVQGESLGMVERSRKKKHRLSHYIIKNNKIFVKK